MKTPKSASKDKKDKEHREKVAETIEDDFDSEFVSKSAKKREMRYIHDLAAQLVDLSAGDFAALDLDEDLRAEVELARKVKAHGARRRQLRFLGQYISGMEHGAVERALATLKRAKTAEIARFHGLESLRNELMEGSEEAVDHVMQAFPNADRQQVRTMARNALKDQSGAGRVRQSRAIFQFLKSLSEQKNGVEE